MIYKRARVFLFLLISTLEFAGQSLNFRNYTVDQGLAFVGVNAIYQDSHGNLWSGGYGGLSRFDGKTFTNYSPKNGLASHQVLAITGDTAGNLWIGTQNGLSILRAGKFTTYVQKDGLPDDKVNCLLCDSRGRIWIGTDKGLCILNGTHFTSPPSLLDSVNTSVHALFEDSRHLVWVGTDKGIVCISPDEHVAHVFNRFNGLTDDHVNSIYQDTRGKYWIGTDKGITCFEKDLLGHSSATVLHGIRINSVNQDLQGNLWISTDLGLWKYDGSEFKNISLGHELNANRTSCLYLDFEKNLWIGTYSGLFRYRSADFVSYGQDDGIVPPFITQLTRDRQRNLWIGTQGGGIYVYKNNHFYNYSLGQGLPSNNITSVIEASDGAIWIGTDHGFCTCPPVSDPSVKPRFKRPSKDVHLHSDTIDILFQDSKGAIWFGGTNGVTRYQNGSYTWIPISASKKDFTIYYFLEDEQHTLWAGSYLGGLFRYEGNSFVQVSKELGMKSDSYLAMLQDKEGIYYFGTFDGVYMYDPKGRYGEKLVQFSEADGLSSDLVYLLTFADEEETLWVGTNQSLNKIDLGAYKHNRKKKIIPYGKEEGFTGSECNGSAVCLEPNGTIWFGTVNGLICYNPAEHKSNLEQPRTGITHIRLFYSDTVLAEHTELGYDKNNLSFEYIGVCLTNPEKVRYLVQLEGFDQNWSPVTSSTIATYSNLPPGQYRFKVMSSNNEGIWNSNAAGFRFTILAPFWKRAWFSVVLALVVISLVVLIFRFRISQVREKENLKLRVATNEMKALRSQMNPHFIFNSLNSIQHFIVHNDEVSASKYLNTFAKLIRTILNNSEKSTVSIREEIDSLRLYLQLESLRFESKFESEIVIDPGLDLDYHEVPTMLIQPFAENAIIHGLIPKNGNGKLTIRLFQEDKHIVCSITDNGIGRKKALQLKETSVRKTHKSFGLKITQDRLELLNYLHKSNLSVKITDLTDEGGMASGTRVDIYIPVFE